MKGTLPQRVRLGVFEVDLRAGELRQDDGAVLLLSDQPLQILRILIEADGEIVTRDEIRQRLWPDDTIVEFDHSINNAIKKLRRALVDSGDEPHYIGTIAKRGYRLLVPVERIGTEEDSPVEPNQTAASSTRAEARGRDDTGGRDHTVDAVNKSRSAGQIIAEPRRRSRWTWLAAGAVMVCALALAGGLYWRAHRPPKLTERDTIVLADFDNKTGDPVFDDTLQQALSIQLQQSPFLNVLSDRKVRATLKLMNRAGATLSADVTREICVRTSSKAMLLGSITASGHGYVIDLKAVGCNRGDTLAETQDQAAGKDTVLKALDRAASTLRGRLGESLSSVEKYATPLAELTTPSLEALKAYSLARKTSVTKGQVAALPYLKRAVELDPNFAIAYAALAVVYSNLGEDERSTENASMAYKFRERVSDRERFEIEGQYYHYVTGELDKAAHSYEMWLQIYPRDYLPHANLGHIYFTLGNFAGSSRESQSAMRLEPNNVNSYSNFSVDSMASNRLEDAESTFKQAQERGLQSGNLLLIRYSYAFVTGDTALMAQTAAAGMGKPGVEDWLFATQADTERWYGKLSNARKLTRQAIESAQRNDAKETAANYQAAATLREATAGNVQLARAYASEALQLAQSRDVKAITALALAHAGDTAGAEKLSVELATGFPLDTIVHRYWLPTIRAAIALQNGDPRHAVELLETARTIELGQPTMVGVLFCPVYVRGEAYLMMHDGNAAATEFQKFIDHYGLIGNDPWGALARLGLARAYALEAQTDPAARDKARTAYQNFLTLWKDADPDIPIYKEAKAEYAKLQ